jgi:subtilisin family serine protease
VRRGGIFLGLLAALALAAPAFALTPNDPTWAEAYAMRQVNMPQAWDISTGDPNVIIATVDTGVEPSVPDLQGALVPGWDFIQNDAVPRDYQGHGTAIATTLVARGNDGQGIAGYCWLCRLMPIRVSSSGADFDATLSANGIRWAVDHGARIISLSFSDEGTYSNAEPQVASAIAYAFDHNVLVLAAAGNSSNVNPTHPASDPGAYAVAATTASDTLYPWSTSGSWVPLAAPGCQLVVYPWRAYGETCGASLSAPAAAGVAALMLSVNRNLTPAQIVAGLKATAVPVAGIGGGRIDAFRALLWAAGKPFEPPPPPQRPPPPEPPPALQPAPKMTTLKTRVQRGVLRSHRRVSVTVSTGLLTARLQSSKAKSCSLSLDTGSEVLVSSSAKGSRVITLSDAVSAGKYTVDVWCTVAKPRAFALVLRANFA